MLKQKMRDFEAMRGRFAHSAAHLYERRDSAPGIQEVKKILEDIQTSFKAAQDKNEERLKEIETKGTVDPLITETIEKMKADIRASMEVRDKLEELTKRVGRISLRKEAVKDGSEAQLAHKNAFIAHLRNPKSDEHLRALEDAHKKAVAERIEQAKREGATDLELRTVQTTTGAAGGLAVPDILDQTIMRELKEISPLRNLVEVITVGSPSYKRLVDIGGAGYGWVGETDVRAETTTPTLEEVSPLFGMIYAYPWASEESLDDMFFDVEAWLIDSALESFRAGEENAILLGNGVKKPLGLLAGTAPTAEVDGVRAFGTLQFVKTGQAADWAAADKADIFRALPYQLKKGYRSAARWLMNKMTAGEIMLFKDGDGNYLWQPSSLEGQPDRFMGYPVSESEEMPDKAANTFPVAFGDFKKAYLLCDLVGLRITPDEITKPGYKKWYIRRRLGGIGTMSEAVKLAKVSA